jgi:uncharacterized protein
MSFGWNEVQFVLLAFSSELLGTLSGFGSSTFFIPLAQLFEQYHLVLVLTSALHVFGNLNRLFQFPQELKLQQILIYVLPSMLCSFLGAMLNPYLPLRILEKALAIFLIGIAIYQLLPKLRNQRILGSTSGSSTTAVLVALSGFLTGLLGTGGAIRGAALLQLSLPSSAFIHLSSLIDVAGDFLRLLVYLYNGYMDWSHWFYLPLLAVAAFLGTRLAKKILQKLPQEKFYTLVSVFILLSALVLLFKS